MAILAPCDCEEIHNHVYPDFLIDICKRWNILSRFNVTHHNLTRMSLMLMPARRNKCLTSSHAANNDRTSEHEHQPGLGLEGRRHLQLSFNLFHKPLYQRTKLKTELPSNTSPQESAVVKTLVEAWESSRKRRGEKRHTSSKEYSVVEQDMLDLKMCIILAPICTLGCAARKQQLLLLQHVSHRRDVASTAIYGVGKCLKCYGFPPVSVWTDALVTSPQHGKSRRHLEDKGSLQCQKKKEKKKIMEMGRAVSIRNF